MQNYSIPNYLHEVENQLPLLSKSNNKYVYFKQNFVPNVQKQPVVASKVLVNPHFNKKVFVNPNYIPNNQTTSSGKIHVNPNVASIHRDNTATKIHINPKILQNASCSIENKSVPININSLLPKQNIITYASKTKLIRTPVKEQTIQESRRIRRTSIYSKFKVIKSSLLNKSPEIKTKNKLLFNSKYKLKRESTNKLIKSSPVKLMTRFKLDNRRKYPLNNSQKNTKYVFVNRFLSISDIAKSVPLRSNKSLLNISGIIYKNSPNRLQRVLKKEKRKIIINTPNKPLSKTRYKIVRVSHAKSSIREKKKIVKSNSRFSIKKQKVSREKLKKCNIPCLYYKKFGKCKGKDQGKCPRKHDPDQIALCTKFLQGACIDSKCLLSHNVSAEKMPTCKFYLEGSCSKDNCPYLHVRISPKADICKDFLEGFCKKASECDKRHQFLCPDFEKKGTCQKTRCPYPHGRMVRKYSDYNKNKFAKKSSKNKDSTKNKTNTDLVDNKIEENIQVEEINPAIRYYSDKKTQNSVQSVSNDVEINRQINFRIRPKLGELPSFISLEDT